MVTPPLPRQLWRQLKLTSRQSIFSSKKDKKKKSKGVGCPLELNCHCVSFPLDGSLAWGQWAGCSERIRYELRRLFELLRPSCLSQPWWSSRPSISKAEPAVHSQDRLNALVLSLLAGRCLLRWPKEQLFPYASQRGQRTRLLPPGLEDRWRGGCS